MCHRVCDRWNLCAPEMCRAHEGLVKILLDARAQESRVNVHTAAPRSAGDLKGGKEQTMSCRVNLKGGDMIIGVSRFCTYALSSFHPFLKLPRVP